MGDWIEWDTEYNGGGCPIKSEKTQYEVKLTTGSVYKDIYHSFKWDGSGLHCAIIAYRIVEDHEPKDEPAMTHKEIEAEITKLQAKLDALPVVVMVYWNGVSATINRFDSDTHTFEVITINGVPHINGVAMKTIEN